MSYKELLNELLELRTDEFNAELVDSVITILSKMHSIYYNECINKKVDNRYYVNEIALVANNLLKNKLRELNSDFTNANINDIISGIIGRRMFINDIFKLENYVFVEGKTAFDFSDKNILLSVNSNLKDITSLEFSDCLRKVNYINSPIGKNTLNRIVEILNSYLKDYFNMQGNILTSDSHGIIYSTPLVNIRLNKSLDEICHGIIDNDIYNIEVVVTYNDEVHLFDLKLGSDVHDITEVKSDVWKLSETNNKKKVK